jgi:GTP-binding protein
MPLPRIAIVGRPNVGKSSIMNMLAGAKVSIVDPTPGVTRDRVTALIELKGADPSKPHKLVEITDTGGYGVYVADGARFDDAGEDLATLTGSIESQIAAAAERSDLILFVIDTQSGITALDRTIAQLLRERLFGGRGKPRQGTRQPIIRVVANKVDAENWETHAIDAASLGFGEPLIVSAMTNFRRRDFTERLSDIVPAPTPDDERAAIPEMKMALVGRRNAGKSSFVNALAGEERCIVSEIAGTTRDAIDVRFEIDGRVAVAIDTAGVRRRTKFADAVEYWAFDRCLLAIGRADVVLMLIDASEEITGIDKRLGARVLAEHKPCVIVVTKWDLAQGRKNRKGKIVTPEDYAEYIAEELPGMAWCPVVFTSSVTKQGLHDAVTVAFELFEQAKERVSTSKLNDVLRAILSERGPSSKLGTKAKILYVTQIGVCPPTIVVVVNKPDLFTPGYLRYLHNRLHEQLPFAEVPIRLLIRERDRMGLSALMRRGGAHDEAEARLIEPRAHDAAGAGIAEDGFEALEPLGAHDGGEDSPAFDEAEEWLDEAGIEGEELEVLAVDEADEIEDDDEEIDLSDLDDAGPVAAPTRRPSAPPKGAKKPAPSDRRLSQDPRGGARQGSAPAPRQEPTARADRGAAASNKPKPKYKVKFKKGATGRKGAPGTAPGTPTGGPRKKGPKGGVGKRRAR